ncbi:MAG TPA: BMC domain-containing protein [Phycisphaerae bacterium]|nr:BMC domain-containing protein [Phycisphaerae bacterium]
MTPYPAIAIVELDSVATGTTVGDAMVKAAPIDRIHAGTIHRGKYLVLVGGSVASVEESLTAGLRVGGESVVDHVLLADVHEEVHDAVFGKRRDDTFDALGIIETETVAATVRAAEAGVKGALVHVKEIRLGDGLAGKGLVHFTGAVADVQAAIEIGTAAIADRRGGLWTTVIPALHEEMARETGESTRFRRWPHKAQESE